MSDKCCALNVNDSVQDTSVVWKLEDDMYTNEKSSHIQQPTSLHIFCLEMTI